MVQESDEKEAKRTIEALYRAHRKSFRTDQDAEDAVLEAIQEAWLHSDARCSKEELWAYIWRRANRSLAFAGATLYRRYEYRKRAFLEDSQLGNLLSSAPFADPEFERLCNVACGRLDLVEQAVLNDLLGVGPDFDRAAFPYHHYRLGELPRQILPLLQEWERRELAERWCGGRLVDTKTIWTKWKDTMRMVSLAGNLTGPRY